MHQYNTFCTFNPAQHAFAEMIEQEPEHYEGLGAFYQAKRDRFREQLLTTKLKPLPVPGGYFQLVDYSAVSDLDDVAFCRWLTIEKGVTAIPLSPFYETRRPDNAWCACVSPRTMRRWTRRSSGCGNVGKQIVGASLLANAFRESNRGQGPLPGTRTCTTSASPWSRAKPAGTTRPATAPITAN